MQNTSKWLLAATLSALFLAFSVYVISVDGLVDGILTAHGVNLWGTQFLWDIILGCGTALALLWPRARRVGVPMPVCVVLTALTGSIGLLACVAWVLYREGAVANSASFASS